MPSTNRRAEQSQAMSALRNLIERIHDVFSRHLPPRGLSDREAILELCRLMGSADTRDALTLAELERKNRHVAALADVIQSAIRILIKRTDPVRAPADYVLLDELIELLESPIVLKTS